jgi:hypothetical protein
MTQKTLESVNTVPTLDRLVSVHGRISMKGLRIVAIVLAVYVGVVVLFESALGYFQPASESTIVLTTVERDGTPNDRVVSKLESDGKLYVAANHWPRAWYNRVLENPELEVTMDGTTGPYRAVSVSGAEHERVDTEHSLPIFFQFLTGFPPRYFVRLDPR